MFIHFYSDLSPVAMGLFVLRLRDGVTRPRWRGHISPSPGSTIRAWSRTELNKIVILFNSFYRFAIILYRFTDSASFMRGILYIIHLVSHIILFGDAYCPRVAYIVRLSCTFFRRSSGRNVTIHTVGSISSHPFHNVTSSATLHCILVTVL